MDLEVTANDFEHATVVHVMGSVDGLTADALTAALQSHLDRGRTQLVCDLSGVNYTSSAGLRVLLGTLRASRQQGGDFRLAAVTPPVLRILELSGFTSILKLYPDVAAALASFVD
jgi:anti-sigma B factor antagonist